jgi:RNA polymerase sigma-70 factor (ECF subfamily)
LAKVKDTSEAIAEAEKLELADSHFYHLLLAELFKKADIEKTRKHLEKAFITARTESQKKVIEKRLQSLQCQFQAGNSFSGE